MKENDAKLDYITISKALGILLVVSGHVGGIYKYIGIPIYYTKPDVLFPAYSLHIPLFIFVSGYFYRPSYIDNLKVLIEKRLKTLVLPYYKWNLFYGVLVTILITFGLFDNGNTITIFNLIIEPLFGAYQYNLNGPAWFMISLFFIQIFYTIIKKIIVKLINNVDLFLLIFLILLVLVSIYISNKIEMKNHNIFLFISRTTLGILYFHLGLCFNAYMRRKIILSYKSLVIIVVVKLLFTVLVGKSIVLSMRTMIFYGNYITPLITSILGILYILNISKLLERLLNKRFFIIRNLINFIGTNTCSIMIHHMAINYFITIIMKNTGITDGNLMSNSIFEFILRPTLCFILAIYFDKYVNNALEYVNLLLKNFNLSYSKLEKKY